MTLSQITIFLTAAGKLDAIEKTQDLILSAVAAQGDKKSIDKAVNDLKKSITKKPANKQVKKKNA